MKYALGNMLNGAGGLNADGLSLDLQFADDKTLTARKGPTPVFTRASSGTFVGSNGLIQSAGNNVARFDHDPVTLVCKGLLIEESRTNVFIASGDFTNANWSKTRSSITANATTAPDGTLTADKLVEDTSILNTHTVSNITVPAVPATLSIFAKKGERNWIVLRVAGSNDFFNLDTGVATTNVNSPKITAFGNGWYRCSVVAVLGTQSSFLMSADGITTSYTGDGTSGIFVWGAQFESGSFPTSYIPTTTASLARSADVCSITGSAFSGFYNNTQGTLVTNASALGFGTSQNPVVSIENGTTQVMRLRYVATTNRLGAIVSAIALTPASNYDVANTFYKAALSAGATSADYVINGTQIPDTYTGSVLTADNMKLSAVSAGISNIHLASVRYYKKQLPVVKLQALTT